MSIEITGARIWLRLPYGIVITETQVNMWLVMLVIAIVCKWLTHNLQVKPTGRRQVIAEYLVKLTTNLVKDKMGEGFKNFAPFIAALFSFALLCSLSSLLGMYPPTADLSTTLGWAIVTFVLILYYKIRTEGFLGYLKGLGDPIPILAPFNILGEFSTPISMAIRLFGNISAGLVISTLVYAVLSWLSSIALQWLPDVLAGIPLLQIGLPAILSIYFDLFSSFLQSFIFCMLTMLYISQAARKEI
ncbi:MAG TPA: F0F1 ATP synthase subunit A [Clostridiales bacterium]|jgi:F-type H+-transporting ATPase subunit a|nr:F0F1 ATP synthase subunit A [Clostridiales bacterium]